MKLGHYEKLALRGLIYTSEDGYYKSFLSIARDGNLDLLKVRRAVRSLARKGLAVFRNALWSDSGRPAGAGYALTERGINELDLLTKEDSIMFEKRIGCEAEAPNRSDNPLTEEKPKNEQ